MSLRLLCEWPCWLSVTDHSYPLPPLHVIPVTGQFLFLLCQMCENSSNCEDHTPVNKTATSVDLSLQHGPAGPGVPRESPLTNQVCNVRMPLCLELARRNESLGHTKWECLRRSAALQSRGEACAFQTVKSCSLTSSLGMNSADLGTYQYLIALLKRCNMQVSLVEFSEPVQPEWTACVGLRLWRWYLCRCAVGGPCLGLIGFTRTAC